MQIIDPPQKPDKVVAEALIQVGHPDIPDRRSTAIWVGHPYQDESGRWFCECYVEGFSQYKIPGSSSFEALTGALCAVRMQLETLIGVGNELFIPELPELVGKEKVMEKLFGLYGYVHSSFLKKSD